MSFADTLHKKILDGREKIATPVVERFRAECYNAAKLGRLQAQLKMSNPYRAAWASAFDFDEASASAALQRAVGGELQRLGLSNVNVDVRIDVVICEAAWTDGLDDAATPEFARPRPLYSSRTCSLRMFSCFCNSR